MATQKSEVVSALKLYRVAARITGTLLLLLVLEMVVRYGLGLDLWFAGPQGFLALVQHSSQQGAMPNTGLNLSTSILVIHGWFYVLYLYSDFRVWTLLRWSFTRFLVIAAGGVVPLLSFFTERHYAKVAAAQVATQFGADD
jgi:integral membrane protein